MHTSGVLPSPRVWLYLAGSCEVLVALAVVV